MNLSASMQSTATGRAENSFAGSSQSFGGGGWSVNMGGSGVADFQANADAAGQPSANMLSANLGGLPIWAWALVGVGVLWALK